MLDEDDPKTVSVSKGKITSFEKIAFTMFANLTFAQLIKQAKEEKIEKKKNARSVGVKAFNLLIKVTNVSASPGEGATGRRRPDKIEGCVMDETGKTIAQGMFNYYNFHATGIEQISKGMLLLLPVVHLKRNTFWTDGIYLEVDIQYTMFDGSIFKVEKSLTKLNDKNARKSIFFYIESR